MIDRITKNDLLELAQEPNSPCVTVYLGTEKTGREIYKPVSRLKHLVKLARHKLAGNWMSSADAIVFLQPVIDVANNHEFWQNTDQGCAFFLDSNGLKYWRVPIAFAEQVFVSNQFFVRPILAAANCDDQFYILALSQNKVRLFEANETQIEKIDVPEIPAGLQSTMNLSSVDRGSQVHTASREHQGKQAAVFHGHGGRSETASEDLRYYYRQVNHAVATRLSGKRRPMVLACVADQSPMYREMNTYPYLLDPIAAGNTDDLSQPQIHARALPIIKTYQSMVVESAIESYRQMINTTRTLSETSSILAAAHLGQIDTLLINKTVSIDGQFNPVDQTIGYRESTEDFDKDLIEDAIAQTLLHRGEVFSLENSEMPSEEPMAAILRY